MNILSIFNQPISIFSQREHPRLSDLEKGELNTFLKKLDTMPLVREKFYTMVRDVWYDRGWFADRKLPYGKTPMEVVKYRIVMDLADLWEKNNS